MDERMQRIQETLRRWWWAIGSGLIGILVGGCCPIPLVMYGPPPVPEYGPPPMTMTPMVLYGPPPTPVGSAPDLPGELLGLLSIVAFAAVGIVWMGRHRNK
ncbi:MAG: hypothetical protein KKA73_21075 [Chloroflexi bacterium]|nr:hypothetical protein [Chloroflexota bacterium]MBU1750186.1 hypothetical protein [Chloroflexota bacterium]MBU1878263.1 hypothetical protein [Chloroflexota bacterium]